MRLTLRTLLAYMDDILDPRDQVDISKQIEESEKATELILRTRDSMRRLRLGAPPVIGEGMELDPNRVAEYLDNTMPSEQMTDFQQVCLDSEVHLAEVASCHHILTMVLGEPAEIDPAMRSRMYAAPEQLDDWHKKRLDGSHAVVAKSAPKSEPAGADSGERTAEVPDYLRASDRAGAGRWVLAMAAALLLGALAVFSFKPGGWLNPNTEIAQAPKGGEPTAPIIEEPIIEEPVIEEPAIESPVDVEPSTGAPEVESPVGETPVVETPPEEGVGEGNAPVLPPSGEAETPVETPVMPEPVELEGVVAEAAEPEGVEPVAPEVAVETEEGPAGEVATPQPEMIASVTPVAPGADADATPPAAEATAPAAPPANVPIGTLVGYNQILLRYEKANSEANSEWRRLAPGSSIASGDRLLSLPTYRPSLALVSGLRVEFSDGAMATLSYSGADADGVVLPRIEVTYGRLLLQNTSKEPVTVEFAVGGEQVRLRLGSASVLGFDVDRPFIPGQNVEESGGPFVANFYAPTGQIVWNTTGEGQPIDQPSQWTWESAKEGKAPESLGDDADWLNGQSLENLEQKVSTSLEKSFDTERPARQQLLEFYENSRRREEKSLGALASTHVGQFIPFVEALADTQQKWNWDEHISHLRKAMSRSPEAAQHVRETLEEQRGAELADDLMEMLRGYGPDQIGTNPEEVRGGVTRKLIDLLDHDRLEYRVLAFHNLRQIYGGKTLRYNPVNTDQKSRDAAIRTWRKRLADNELTPVGA